MTDMTHEEYERNKSAFWLVQSVIDQDTIRRFTSSCEKDDCVISARRVGETTLLAFSNYYDKEGRLITSNKNRHDVALACRKCGRHDLVKNNTKD